MEHESPYVCLASFTEQLMSVSGGRRVGGNRHGVHISRSSCGCGVLSVILQTQSKLQGARGPTMSRECRASPHRLPSIHSSLPPSAVPRFLSVYMKQPLTSARAAASTAGEGKKLNSSSRLSLWIRNPKRTCTGDLPGTCLLNTLTSVV